MIFFISFYSILNGESCCFACLRFTAAPCKVNINRGRIFYNAKKIWIGDLKPNRVLHGEPVVFYCLNKELKCGIPVASQCIDGTLSTPECFKGEALRTKITWSRSLWHASFKAFYYVNRKWVFLIGHVWVVSPCFSPFYSFWWQMNRTQSKMCCGRCHHIFKASQRCLVESLIFSQLKCQMCLCVCLSLRTRQDGVHPQAQITSIWDCDVSSRPNKINTIQRG